VATILTFSGTVLAGQTDVMARLLVRPTRLFVDTNVLLQALDTVCRLLEDGRFVVVVPIIGRCGSLARWAGISNLLLLLMQMRRCWKKLGYDDAQVYSIVSLSCWAGCPYSC